MVSLSPPLPKTSAPKPLPTRDPPRTTQRPSAQPPVTPLPPPPPPTPSASPTTAAAADAWLAQWPTRGPDAGNGIATSIDTQMAAGALHASAFPVHLLYAGQLSSVQTIVAATVCSSCQVAGGGPAIQVVAMYLGGGKGYQVVSMDPAPIGPGIGVVPFPSSSGAWALAIIEAPGVGSAQVLASGGGAQPVTISSGVGMVDSLPDPQSGIQVKLLDATGTVVYDQPLPQWSLAGQGASDFQGGGSHNSAFGWPQISGGQWGH